MSFGSYPGIFCSIKAIACVFRLLMTKEVRYDRGTNINGKGTTDHDVYGSGNDMSVDGFLPSESKIKQNLRQRGLYLSAGAFQELDLGKHDND